MTTVALPDDAVLEVLRQVADAYRDDPENVTYLLENLGEAHHLADDHDAQQTYGHDELDGVLHDWQRIALRELVPSAVMLNVAVTVSAA